MLDPCLLTNPYVTQGTPKFRSRRANDDETERSQIIDTDHFARVYSQSQKKNTFTRSSNHRHSPIMAYVKLEVYVPTTHATAVKTALSEGGAGHLGNYDSCIWMTVGTGQFRPLAGSNPFLGTQGALETVEEAKLECICDESKIAQVIVAMKRAHPYETVAFSYHRVNIE